MSSCAGKKRFDDQGAADTRLAEIAADPEPGPVPGRKPIRSYWCRDCMGWHLTSQTLRPRVSS